MKTVTWKQQIKTFDERREIAIPGDAEATLAFAVEQLIAIANEAIDKRGIFTIALSGGATPKAIFERLSNPRNSYRINWDGVLVFWSDERSVPPTHPDSNYRMAMEAGFDQLPIPDGNIFRMATEGDIEKNALAYEKLIAKHVAGKSFDLVMLGMGDDGHTASLFPNTEGLKAKGRLVIANHVPAKSTWRMSLTFDCINAAKNISIYVIGASKASMLTRVLKSPYDPTNLPSQQVGTRANKALWIADSAAVSTLNPN